MNAKNTQRLYRIRELEILNRGLNSKDCKDLVKLEEQGRFNVSEEEIVNEPSSNSIMPKGGLGPTKQTKRSPGSARSGDNIT